LLFLPTPRYASAGTSHGPVSVSVCLSVTSRCFIKLPNDSAGFWQLRFVVSCVADHYDQLFRDVQSKLQCEPATGLLLIFPHLCVHVLEVASAWWCFWLCCIVCGAGSTLSRQQVKSPTDPPPTHSFTLGLNPSFSANPPYPSLSFFSFRFHSMDFPDCLLYFWAYPSFYFLVFLFLHFFSCRFRAVD